MKKIWVQLILAVFPCAFNHANTPLNIPIGQRFKKVIWIVFHNAKYETAMNQEDFKRVSEYGALFTNFVSRKGADQSNYIDMIAGSPLDVKNNNIVNLQYTHVGDLLELQNKDWRLYAEDYPGNCFAGASSKLYVRSHNPFISFTNVSADRTRCRQIVAASDYDNDYKSDLIPEFTMYIPNLNDGGANGINAAGKWLTRTFEKELSRPFELKDKLFIITFDGSASGHIYTVLIGRSIIPNSVNKQLISYSALLKMVEEEYAIGTLGREDYRAPEIKGIWR